MSYRDLADRSGRDSYRSKPRFWYPYHEYLPVAAGSIDDDATGDPQIQSDPYCTLFVGRLAPDTTEDSLVSVFKGFVTGESKRYAFVEFERASDMRAAYHAGQRLVIEGREVLVDYERERLVKGWVPRRLGAGVFCLYDVVAEVLCPFLGGGLGGRKESGQLRFGGRDRPFRAPALPSINADNAENADRNLDLYRRGRAHDSPPRRDERSDAHADSRERDRQRERD